MRHKKLKLSVVLMLVLGLTGLQAQNLYLMDKSGTQAEVAISDISKITFSDGNMVISKLGGETESFLMTDLRYFNFENLATSVPMNKLQSLGEMPLVFPNPVNDLLYIKLSASAFKNARVEIISLDGRVMVNEVIDDNTTLYQANVSSLNTGLYLCRVLNDSNTKTIKFYKN